MKTILIMLLTVSATTFAEYYQYQDAIDRQRELQIQEQQLQQQRQQEIQQQAESRNQEMQRMYQERALEYEKAQQKLNW